MINYKLSTTVNIDGTDYSINKNGDYRMVLDVISVLNDDELTQQQKAYCALNIFYDFNIPENTPQAVNEMMVFINCGEADNGNDKKQPLMSWEQDFPLLVAPINRVLGYEIRSAPYIHWWTFVSGYMEIGESSFSNVVSIRSKKRKGVKLDKWEQEYYNENRQKIDLNVKFDREEQEFIDNLLGLQ